jgi:hypothetical protein
MKLSELTPDDWSNFGSYVAYVRDKLGLHTWSIHIEHRPCSKHHQASICPVYGRTHAVLRLCRTWPDVSPKEQRHTVIHELLHLHFVSLQSTVGYLEPIICEDVWHILSEAHTEKLEYAIDAIAYILTEQFDMPPVLSGNTEAVPETETIIDKYDDSDVAESK